MTPTTTTVPAATPPAPLQFGFVELPQSKHAKDTELEISAATVSRNAVGAALLELVGVPVTMRAHLSLESLLASTYTDEQTLDELTFELGI